MVGITREEKEELYKALQRAIFEGVLEVAYSDKRVKYGSFEDMRKRLDLLKVELGITKKTCRVGASFSKGLYDGQTDSH